MEGVKTTIDAFFVNLIGDCNIKVQDTIRILSSFVSDHSPVELTLKPINSLPRGAGIWKFNDSFLKQKDFVDKSNELFDQIIAEHSNLQPKQLFELVKFKFKGFARKIAIEKSKNDRIEEMKLNEKKENLKKSLVKPRKKTIILPKCNLN